MSGLSEPVKTDRAVIIGAGPAGLWAAFQLGIHGIRSILLDSLSLPGGQCAALYADKPIYDMPGFPAIDAGALVDRLKQQLARFEPQFRLGQTVEQIRSQEGHFLVETGAYQVLSAELVVIATGLGPLGGEGRKNSLTLPGDIAMANGLVEVRTDTFETALPGLFAIGDAITYPGKLCLLVSACHEAALMAFAIRQQRAGGKRVALEYSSTSSQMKSLFTDR